MTVFCFVFVFVFLGGGLFQGKESLKGLCKSNKYTLILVFLIDCFRYSVWCGTCMLCAFCETSSTTHFWKMCGKTFNTSFYKMSKSTVCISSLYLFHIYHQYSKSLLVWRSSQPLWPSVSSSESENCSVFSYRSRQLLKFIKMLREFPSCMKSALLVSTHNFISYK